MLLVILCVFVISCSPNIQYCFLLVVVVLLSCCRCVVVSRFLNFFTGRWAKKSCFNGPIKFFVMPVSYYHIMHTLWCLRASLSLVCHGIFIKAPLNLM